MEKVVFLFPENDSSEGISSAVLRDDSLDLSVHFVLSTLAHTISLNDVLKSASQYIVGYYFAENVSRFSRKLINRGYPREKTALRNKIKHLKEASAEFAPAPSEAAVFSEPVQGTDVFVRLANGADNSSDSLTCVFSGLTISKESVEVTIGNRHSKIDWHHDDARELLDWLAENHSPARVFGHNPKHDREFIRSGGKHVSMLECTEDEVQFFLNRAFVCKKGLVYYDRMRGKHVHFRMHRANQYHGFHSEDEIVENSVEKLLKAFC